MPDESSVYQVIGSQAVMTAFEELVGRAFARGVGPEVLEASRLLVERLVHDPQTLGEPLYRMRGMQMTARVAIQSPLVVAYSVHEEKRLVFIKHFKMLPGYDDF